jgi:L-xylulokinase
MSYFIGLDNGGTLTKAALYDQNGKEIGVCSAQTRMITPKPGFTERDMEEMWQANCHVLRGLIEKTKVNPADISGIACCGHGKGLYLWGVDDKPVRNGIISTDNRAFAYPEQWKRDGTAEKVFALSYQSILACQPVSLLAWLRDNEPASIPQIKYIFECKDYVRFRLTGQAFAEITDYSGANFVNLETKQYDQELLRLFGIEFAQELLPPLRNSTDICGYITEETATLTGLKAGTPVAGGMFDIDACAIAVGAAHEERLCMIAGTWSINEYIRKEAVKDGKVMMNSLFCQPDYYLIEECSPTSAGNNEWFINTLLPELKEEQTKEGKSIYETINSMVESIPVAEFCPIFLPFLMASNVHPHAKGSFIGLSNYHTRAHMMRSVYEGIAFSHKYHFDRLLATRDQPVREIRLAGGVANSKVWTQIFADVMQHPITTVDVNETGALGCAMAAAVATGVYRDFTEAEKQMVKIKGRTEPVPANKINYEKKYELYLQLINSLDGVWNNIQQLM